MFSRFVVRQFLKVFFYIWGTRNSDSVVIILHHTCKDDEYMSGTNGLLIIIFQNTTIVCFKGNLFHLWCIHPNPDKIHYSVSFKNGHIYKLTEEIMQHCALVMYSNQLFKRRHCQLNSTWLQDNHTSVCTSPICIKWRNW